MTVLKKDPRDILNDIITKTKTVNMTPPTVTALVDAIMLGLSKAGAEIVGDGVDGAAASGNHLLLLKRMRDRISEACADADTPPRDLAALTRRLQDISREIDGIEERLKNERKSDSSNGKSSASTSSASKSSGSQPIDA